MANSEKAQEALLQLQAGVEKLVTGDDWKRALEVQARFHKYSFANTMLIWMQCPQATYVGGMKTVWNKMGRFVKKGERAINILAPILIKDKDEETGRESKVCIGFKTVGVFDLSQTDGEPFVAPDILSPEELDGDAPAHLIDAMSGLANDRNFRITEGQMFSESMKGYTQPDSKEIVLKGGVSSLQKLKTLIHEIAHVILHIEDEDFDYRTCRGQAEIEAESVAFVVCSVLGLPTDDYSFAYVGGWSNGDMDEVRKAGERVAKTAKTILAARPPTLLQLDAEAASNVQSATS